MVACGARADGRAPNKRFKRPAIIVIFFWIGSQLKVQAECVRTVRLCDSFGVRALSGVELPGSALQVEPVTPPRSPASRSRLACHAQELEFAVY